METDLDEYLDHLDEEHDESPWPGIAAMSRDTLKLCQDRAAGLLEEAGWRLKMAAEYLENAKGAAARLAQAEAAMDR